MALKSELETQILAMCNESFEQGAKAMAESIVEGLRQAGEMRAAYLIEEGMAKVPPFGVAGNTCPDSFPKGASGTGR